MMKGSVLFQGNVEKPLTNAEINDAMQKIIQEREKYTRTRGTAGISFFQQQPVPQKPLTDAEINDVMQKIIRECARYEPHINH